MTISRSTSVDDVVNHITSLAGKIPAHAITELRTAIDDGLNPDFLDDAGIETMAQHLEDVAERLAGSLDGIGYLIHTPDGKTQSRSLKAALKAVNKARGI